MKAMINIGSKRSKKNLKKLAAYVRDVFKSAKKNKRGRLEVCVALELAVKAFSTDYATVSGCTLSAGKPKRFGLKLDGKGDVR